MKLFVGLGNPSVRYENNRHNIGFMAVDEIVHRHNFSSERRRFQSLTFEGLLAGEKILAIKPQTFMNESGRAVREAMNFYKIPVSDIFVFYDELDLAPFKVKTKTGGGSAGHNGIKSLMAHIGAEFHRIRLGIGHPGDRDRVHNYVLSDFAKTDNKMRKKMLAAISEAAPKLISHDNARFTTDVALHMQPPKQKRPKHHDNIPPLMTMKGSGEIVGGDRKTSDGTMAEALKALKANTDQGDK